MSGLAGLMAIALWQFVAARSVNEYGLHEAFSYDRLLRAAQLEDGYCLLKFDAPFCYPCSFSDAKGTRGAYGSLLDSYVMYELNALDSSGEGANLRDHYSVTKLPTWLVLNHEGQEVRRWEQVVPPSASELEKLETLREIPDAHTQESSQAESIPPFSLRHLGDLTYWEAITFAREIEPVILEPVWIQPEASGQWSVCSGLYRSIGEAEVSKAFHEGWEGRPVDIIALKADLWTLPKQDIKSAGVSF